MRRSTAISQEPGGSCTNLRSTYSTMAEFLKFKERELDTSDLDTYVGGLLSTDLQNQGTPQDQAAAQVRVRSNLASLNLLEQRINVLTKCIQQDIIYKQNYSGKIYTLQQEVRDKQASVDEMGRTAVEAKERAKFLEDPYSKTTRWESWFPLGRPLQNESLPVLLSIALFFCTLSLGMFLRLAQIQLKLSIGGNSGASYLSGYGLGR